MSFASNESEQHRSNRGDIVGIGAGGHARVMIQLAQQCGYHIACLLEPAAGSNQKRTLDDIIITHADEEFHFQQLVQKSPKTDKSSSLQSMRPAAMVCVGTARDSVKRTQIFKRLQVIGYETPTLISPSAFIEKRVQLGSGVHVLPGAIVAAGAIVGVNVLINHRAIVEHDCIVGDHVHVATGSILCGRVVIGEGTFVGAGSVVLPGIHIGAGAIVGAGATVTKNIPPGKTYIGSPARLLKK